MSNKTNLSACAEVGQWHKILVMYVSGFITTLTVFAGCVGNIYSIWAMRQVNISKALRMYLITLALWDTGLLICAFSFYGFKALLQLFGIESEWLAYVSQWSHGPCMTTMTGSVWMVLVIMVVRHEAISKPFRHRNDANSELRPKVVCIMVAVVAILYRIPAYFELRVDQCIGRTGMKGVQIYPTLLRLNHFYQLLYRMVLYSLLVSVLPFVIILVLTIRMIILLRQNGRFLQLLMRQSRRKMRGRRRDRNQLAQRHRLIEQRTTTMLLVLIGKFLLCLILPVALDSLEMIKGDAIIMNIYFNIAADVSNYLVVLNSATNFIVYIHWNKKKMDSAKQGSSGLAAPRHLMLAPVLSRDEEKEILKDIWANLKKRQDVLSIGCELIVELLQLKPSMRVHFQISPDEDEIEISKVRKPGLLIGTFLEHVLTAFLENRMAEARALIHKVGQTHYRVGVNLNTEIWCHYKRFLIFKALGLRGDSFYKAQAEELERVVVWNKFLSFIVIEMKRAFLEESEKECRP